MIRKFPDGSVSSVHRLEAATVRALDAHLTLLRKADQLSEVLDRVPPVPASEPWPDDEDSLVIAIKSITHERGS